MLEFTFPDVGEGIHEGTIVKWRVKEGDEVKSDQVLVEVETDKAIVEIPSPKAGIIGKIFHKEQQIIHVGETLVVLVDKGETYDPAAVSAASSTQEKPAVQGIPTPSLGGDSKAAASLGDKGPGVVGSIDASNTEIPAATPQRSGGAIPAPVLAPKILPATRMLAQKLGVDVTKLIGTGPNGLITDQDIQGAKGGVSITSAPVSPATSVQASTTPSQPKTFSGEVTRTPYKGIRKAIGDHMITSLTKAAQVTHVDTVDVSKLVAKREAEKAAAESQNIKITFLAYITKAITETLKEFPIVNSELDESTQEIITKNFYNIGIAVDTEDGLFVPTIKNADKKDLFTVAQEITDLAEKARTKKLTPTEMSGGTFTITNYGSIGGDFATPVINYPEAAILGLGKMKDAVVVDPVTKQPVVTKTMTLALTFDHRLIDGATAARFVNALGQRLQM
ncbi:2-oxo acid dehydrogenase subunit E2 [Candidatus Gracilibacteria bacterium]|nr:2-oxo acid dehydrogenase subunit E2 [Candidatus Gracilibacteria bacterium]